MSSFIFRTNPGLSQPSCEQPSRGVYPPGTLGTRYPPPPLQFRIKEILVKKCLLLPIELLMQ